MNGNVHIEYPPTFTGEARQVCNGCHRNIEPSDAFDRGLSGGRAACLAEHDLVHHRGDGR
jgi:hypothetical protein